MFLLTLMSDTAKPPLEQKKPKEWHPQQSKLLQSWAEIASSYRWMHNQAYMIYKKKNLNFMLPLIIMSTVTGTANFAQSTFPSGIRPYVPQIIGSINLVSAIMTTIYQFLKISEFMESHRISSINYGKLARTITVELNLPVKDRNSGGAECVKVSRTEIDRLIEQSPAIPKSVLLGYEQKFAGKGLAEPEIVVINKVEIFEDRENKVATTVAEAGFKLKEALQKAKKPLFQIKSCESPTVARKETLNKELKSLPKLVSTVNTSMISNMFRLSPKKEPVLPKFPDSVPEPPEIEPEVEPEQPIVINIEPEIDPEIKAEVEDVLDKLVEETVKSSGGISDELEALRTSKLVSKK